MKMNADNEIWEKKRKKKSSISRTVAQSKYVRSF